MVIMLLYPTMGSKQSVNISAWSWMRKMMMGTLTYASYGREKTDYANVEPAVEGIHLVPVTSVMLALPKTY